MASLFSSQKILPPGLGLYCRTQNAKGACVWIVNGRPVVSLSMAAFSLRLPLWMLTPLASQLVHSSFCLGVGLHSLEPFTLPPPHLRPLLLEGWDRWEREEQEWWWVNEAGNLKPNFWRLQSCLVFCAPAWMPPICCLEMLAVQDTVFTWSVEALMEWKVGKAFRKPL